MKKKVWIAIAALCVTTLTGMSASVRGPAADSAPKFVAQDQDPIVSAGYYQPLKSIHSDYAVFRCKVQLELCEVHSVLRGGYTEQFLGMGPLNSEPSLSLDYSLATSSNVPYQYVFWAGPGPHYDLMEAYFNGRWHGPINLGMGGVQSQPAAPRVWYSTAVSGNPNGEAVAWTNARDQVLYATSSDPASKRSWKGPFTTKLGNVGYSLTAVDTGGSFESVWWEENGDLYAGNIPRIDRNGQTWGPCNFGMGVVGTTPSVVWVPWTLPDIPGVHHDSQPSAESFNYHAPHWKGNCPAHLYPLSQDWYGAAGQYVACWGGATAKGQLYCMPWALVADTDGEVAGPLKIGNMGVLGSAPSITVWPYSVKFFTPITMLAFWMSSTAKEDLIAAQINPPSKPKDLGFGPIGPLGE